MPKIIMKGINMSKAEAYEIYRDSMRANILNYVTSWSYRERIESKFVIDMYGVEACKKEFEKESSIRMISDNHDITYDDMKEVIDVYMNIPRH